MNHQTTIQPTPEQIAVRAYLLWEKEGRPHGRHEAHWFEAEKQLQLDCTQAASSREGLDLASAGAPPVSERFESKRRKNSKHQKGVPS